MVFPTVHRHNGMKTRRAGQENPLSSINPKRFMRIYGTKIFWKDIATRVLLNLKYAKNACQRSGSELVLPAVLGGLFDPHKAYQSKAYCLISLGITLLLITDHTH